MQVVIACARTLALLGLIFIALSACGSNESAAPTVTVSGPALLFFYTDN